MVTRTLKRAMVGRPLHSNQGRHQLLPKWLALPIFCSDPLSSVAYATDEIILVLILGGLATLSFTPWVGLAVVLLLAVVVTSYRKTVHAYPGGGGAYAVAQDNFGQGTALVAAGALIVDYILTVAVSVTSGVANLISAFPDLDPWKVEISVAVVVVLTVGNLRGIKESGRAFALPTYAFIGSVLLMLSVGFVRDLSGNPVQAPSAGYPVEGADIAGVALVFLLLRAFASGCTALTGVEAISNGVPFFRPPKSRNASLTLVGMGILAITMFGGITLLAVQSNVRIADDPAELGLPADAVQQTVMAQLGTAVFGADSVGFYVLQVVTMLVLVLAANTAFNSFPILASVLGRDGYLPRQFGRRGDRLVFSNGIVILATAAVVLVIAFDASVTRLIQLYILGVFLSFTISQAGMVRHWNRSLAGEERRAVRASIHRSRAVNALGAVVTAGVLVVVVATKFGKGAWLVIVFVPLFVVLMLAINRHYKRTDERLVAPDGGVTLPSRVHGVVLVSRVNAPAMQALAYSRATRPSTLVALHVQTDRSHVDQLEAEWTRRGIPVPLVVVESPYRDVTTPVVEYVKRLRREGPRDIVSVFIPEYVVTHWWETLLHNQSALRLKTRLLFLPGVISVSVPLLLLDDQETNECAPGPQRDPGRRRRPPATGSRTRSRGPGRRIGSGYGPAARDTVRATTHWQTEGVPRLASPVAPVGRGRGARRAVWFGVGLVVVLLTVLAASQIQAADLSVVLLVVLVEVLAIGVLTGPVLGATAAFIAVVIVNWFVVPPFHTFEVASVDNLVALVVFTVVAVAAALLVELAARARARAATAVQQTVLLGDVLSLDEDDDLNATLDRIRVALDVHRVTLSQVATAPGTGPNGAEERLLGAVGAADPDDGVCVTVSLPDGYRLDGFGPERLGADPAFLTSLAAGAVRAWEGDQLSEERRRSAHLAAIDVARTTLLAAVGHDLRTPLSALRVSVDALAAGHDYEPSDRDALLDTIIESTRRLDELISNLLDMSRLEAGAVLAHPEPVTAEEVVARAVLGSPGVAPVNVDVPPDLPELLVDPALLERILANLLSNAARYAGDGPIEVRVTRCDGSARIDVVDHGSGVPAEAREIAMLPFRTVDSSGKGDGGTGLGLAIVSGFARASGATVELLDTPGGGLTARVVVPMARVPDDAVEVGEAR